MANGVTLWGRDIASILTGSVRQQRSRVYGLVREGDVSEWRTVGHRRRQEGDGVEGEGGGGHGVAHGGQPVAVRVGRLADEDVVDVEGRGALLADDGREGGVHRGVLGVVSRPTAEREKPTPPIGLPTRNVFVVHRHTHTHTHGLARRHARTHKHRAALPTRHAVGARPAIIRGFPARSHRSTYTPISWLAARRNLLINQASHNNHAHCSSAAVQLFSDWRLRSTRGPPVGWKRTVKADLIRLIRAAHWLDCRPAHSLGCLRARSAVSGLDPRVSGNGSGRSIVWHEPPVRLKTHRQTECNKGVRLHNKAF